MGEIVDTRYRVFPTHVGVYRLDVPLVHLDCRFPHACGGVPGTDQLAAVKLLFSPRMWGCTGVFMEIPEKVLVFPTHVGVYRYCARSQWLLQRFPHACGGVPKTGAAGSHGHSFSPRMWGCTDVYLTEDEAASVFPTHVGVYRQGEIKHDCIDDSTAKTRSLTTKHPFLNSEIVRKGANGVVEK